MDGHVIARPKLDPLDGEIVGETGNQDGDEVAEELGSVIPNEEPAPVEPV